jgi:hypothetical protein
MRDTPNTQPNIITEAVELAHQTRAAEYGNAPETLKRVGLVWTGILGLDTPITNEQVALMMSGLKLVRANKRKNDDDLVDGVGYLILAADCRNTETTQPA